jgi:hypothetical protein
MSSLLCKNGKAYFALSQKQFSFSGKRKDIRGMICGFPHSLETGTAVRRNPFRQAAAP